LLEKEPDMEVVGEADLVTTDTYQQALRNGLISIDIAPLAGLKTRTRLSGKIRFRKAYIQKYPV